MLRNVPFEVVSVQGVCSEVCHFEVEGRALRSVPFHDAAICRFHPA